MKIFYFIIVENRKKMFVLIGITVMSQFVFAQEKKETIVNRETHGMIKKYHGGGRHDKKEMMKDLNLSETQKSQMKEMRLANKAKKDVIMSDKNLSEEQKHGKLKELREANSKEMRSIFTEEQKTKLKAAKEKMKLERQHHSKEKYRKEKSVDSTKL